MTRIVQRYTENVNYLFNFLFSMREVSHASLNQDFDIYGFRKSLIALTNHGKIISFSSLNGKTLWSSSYFNSSPIQILLRNHFIKETETTEVQVVTCF